MKHGAPVAIHDVALVSGRHPARLFVLPTSAALNSSELDFAWRISESENADIDSKLAVPESSIAGHQYFTLARTNAKLMVSVGEYSDDWWQHAA
jgi:hypothetical protein